MEIAFNRSYELKPGLFRCFRIRGNQKNAFQKEFSSGNCIMLSEEKYLFTGIPVSEEDEYYFFVRPECILTTSKDTTSFEEIPSRVR